MCADKEIVSLIAPLLHQHLANAFFQIIQYQLTWEESGGAAVIAYITDQSLDK